MGFSLKKLFTPPRLVRDIVNATPLGPVLKIGAGIGGAVDKLTGRGGGGMMLAGGGGPCPPGTYPSSAYNVLGMISGTKCMPLPGGGMMPTPQGAGGMPMPGMDPAGLTPYGIAAYCAASTGLGKIRLMPSPCRGFHWNESRYYVYGNPWRGTEAGTVERGTKLVRNRRINPANAQAARRAVRRLNGTYSLLRSIERSMVKLGGRTAKRARAASSKRGDGKC